jgi:two-component system sensor histidine kinase/response regulator
MSDIRVYLDSFLNKPEDTLCILKQYMSHTGSEKGAIFVKNNSCKYHVLAQYPEYEVVSYVDEYPINSILIDNNVTKSSNFKTLYNVNTLMIIPVLSNLEIIGTVCLVNNTNGYTKDTNVRLSSYTSLLQIICSKHQVINEYKNTFSNEETCRDLFLANMSHEIRTPLNGVIGYNQLLLQTDMTQVQKSYLTSMNQCSIQLMQIINDILDFSKLTSGKMGVNSECLSLKDVNTSVSCATRQRIFEKRQKYNFVIHDDVPSFIILDKQKLIQIIINLVTNANKFTDIGGVIDVIVSQCANEHRIRIEVKDNGIGISETDQCKLFNSFTQIEASTFKTGSGLGLAISKKLCELLNGEIKLKSNIGIGSTFSFTVEYKPIEELSQEMTRDAKLLKDKVILVVDDNMDNRIMISEMLFQWEMKPVICASALEALRMILSDRYTFSLGLIDICMPGTTGIELAKQIKEDRPFFPLIALSSVDYFVDSGEFEHKLDKPINKIQLFNTIHNVLSKKQKPSSYIGDSDSDNDKRSSTLMKLSRNGRRPSVSDSSCQIEQFNMKSKILVVEDIVYNRVLLTSMLSNLKYTNVEEAENGLVALDKIKNACDDNKKYDVVLLDLRMPVMDGYDLVETMKNENILSPKIIIVSASVTDKDRNKCKQMGVDYFINKPIELQQLKDVMFHITDTL